MANTSFINTIHTTKNSNGGAPIDGNAKAVATPRVFRVPSGFHAAASYSGYAAKGGYQDVSYLLPPPLRNTAEAARSSPQIIVPREDACHAPSEEATERKRASVAIEEYLEERASENENCSRVLVEKRRLYGDLLRHLSKNYPALGDDPWVDEIRPSHIYSFIKVLRKLPGRIRFVGVAPGRSSARTVDKKIRMLFDFFGYCVNFIEVMVANPVHTSVILARKLKDFASKEGRHYQPFTNAHIQKIFDPVAYLARARLPDTFWMPLIAIHLGVRAGDIVRCKLSDIGYDADNNLWYIDIHSGYAKNNNSIRRLPIVEGLVRLGFIDYLKHVKSLGGELIFPHRDYTTKTLERDPSKRCSESFAAHLTACDLVHPDLVFHSFRHTVVSALHDGGATLADAMQICGHEAQDHAVRAGVINKKQASSLHLPTYTHANRPRMNVVLPTLRLKDEIERCVAPPLDYAGLKIAADIVREHLRKEGGKFVAGWAPQNKRYFNQLATRFEQPGRQGGDQVFDAVKLGQQRTEYRNGTSTQYGTPRALGWGA